MKKNIGSVVALYPTPVTVVGVMNQDKPNWLMIAHIGIISHDQIMISCAKAHKSDAMIRANNKVSVNIINEELLKKADYVGSVSAAKVDKSAVFDYELGEAGTPVIKNAPVSMECEVVDIYDTPVFDDFILKVDNTYADEHVLGKDGKLNYEKIKPILFEMPSYKYISTGSVLGTCMKMHE
jgi:flavin reductase (DIM6/NTAB) family NADH-FMN oxidoreductase RutF